MKLKKISLLVLILIIGFVSCKKDDDDGDIVAVEDRDRGEQQEADIDSIQKYLKNHYYNAEELATKEYPSTSDLVIVKVEDGETAPEGYSMLKEAVDSLTTIYADTNYKFYIFKLNQGTGDAPTFADNVRVTYEGFTLDDEVFDSAINPIDLDLVGNRTTANLGTIRGWQVVFPEFNTAQSFSEHGDGTVDYLNYGAGVMFIPSGLAYFSTAQSGIASYSPLVFKFELLQMSQNDHDGDGVPSFMEDIKNKDGDNFGEFVVNYDDLTDGTDDDTDGDGYPDYIDIDDDGDGIPTINEDIDGDGDPTNDIGKNGIPKYLDPEEVESN